MYCVIRDANMSNNSNNQHHPPCSNSSAESVPPPWWFSSFLPVPRNTSADSQRSKCQRLKKADNSLGPFTHSAKTRKQWHFCDTFVYFCDRKYCKPTSCWHGPEQQTIPPQKQERNWPFLQHGVLQCRYFGRDGMPHPFESRHIINYTALSVNLMDCFQKSSVQPLDIRTHSTGESNEDNLRESYTFWYQWTFCCQLPASKSSKL